VPDLLLQKVPLLGGHFDGLSKKAQGYLKQLQVVDPTASIRRSSRWDDSARRNIPGWEATIHNKTQWLGDTWEDVDIWFNEGGFGAADADFRVAETNRTLGLPEDAQTGRWVVEGYDPQGSPFTMEEGRVAAEKIKNRHRRTNYDELLKQGYDKEAARELMVSQAPSDAARMLDEVDYAARMADATERGYNRTLYHGTRAPDVHQIDFNEVDLGLHVGSPEQATNRLKDLADPTGLGRSANYSEGANILPLRVRANNPLELKDVGNWRDSHQVLAALKDSPAFVKNADKIVDMFEEADELLIQHEEIYSGQFKGYKWFESPENRRLLDEIRSTIQDEGYDSVKYLNEVENVYGNEAALTATAQELVKGKRSALSVIENQIRSRMPEVPEPSAPDLDQMWRFLNAKMEDYALPDELQQMSKLRDEISAIKDAPASRNDPYSYIILDSADVIGGISLNPRFRDGGAVKRARL